MSKNSITGDNLVSKPTEGYADGYDLIWGKDKQIDKDIRDTRHTGEARERQHPHSSSREVCSREET